MLLRALHRAHERVHARRVRVLHELLLPLLPAEGSVLDLGCGDGRLSRRIARSLPGVQLRGMDVQPRPGAEIPVAAFDGARVPLPDRSVDCVLLVDVVHHAEQPAVLLREAARVARRAVVIKDHLSDGMLATPLLRVMDWVGNARHGVALPCNYLSRAQWTDAFAQLELAVEQRIDDFRLYGPPLDWVFGRSLHFAARLRPRAR